MPICPATGHFIENPRGLYCAEHGVPWFDNCRNCGALWTAERTSPTNLLQVAGDHFCAGCGTPGPWLSRSQLMQWLRNQVRASEDVSAATRQELLGVLDRLQDMAPEDPKAVSGWQRIRQAAPRVWEASKSVRDALIGEAVRRLLDIG
jgi:hypothetical protein